MEIERGKCRGTSDRKKAERSKHGERGKCIGTSGRKRAGNSKSGE